MNCKRLQRAKEIMSTLQAIRTELATRRAARRERLKLEHELAAFDTPAARLEIETIVARHDPEETRQIRAILKRQASDNLMAR
jgi:hypothetical protein